MLHGFDEQRSEAELDVNALDDETIDLHAGRLFAFCKVATVDSQ